MLLEDWGYINWHVTGRAAASEFEYTDADFDLE